MHPVLRHFPLTALRASVNLRSAGGYSSPPSVSVTVLLHDSSREPSIFFLQSLGYLLSVELKVLSLCSYGL